jgi:hypothetical protein
MSGHQKSREVRLRRTAERRGYMLKKSRSRDPKAVDHGLYALIDVQTGGVVNPSIAQRWACSWTLDTARRRRARHESLVEPGHTV